MKKLLRALLQDTHGSIAPSAMILIVTIVGIGGVVGLVTLRDQIVQELTDVGVSLNKLDQSFSYEIMIDTDGDGNFDTTLMCDYDDNDLCTLCGQPFNDPQGQAPGGLTFPTP